MGAIAVRAFCLFLLAGLLGSCAVVDQYGSRAYDGNLNTQNAINQEVLVNIIRASRYQAISWNPANSITGSQMEQVQTGLPSIFIPKSLPNVISNQLTSSVNGGFTTAPLATTAFQAGMLTPVDLKTVASLATYYPREAVFFALVGAIEVKSISSGRYAHLINDPSAAYYHIDVPLGDMDQKRCNSELFQRPGPQVFFGPSKPTDCSYEKFSNLLGVLIDNGLSTELVQIPGLQPAQAQANQSNLVTVGQLCIDKSIAPQALLFFVQDSNFRQCGESYAKRPLGGTVQVTTTLIDKRDDKIINTDTKSRTKQTVTITNSVLPITGRAFKVRFAGIGVVEITFELRSPNAFLSYLGSWYRIGDTVTFGGYDSIPAQTIYNGGPYVAVLNGLPTSCYSWVNYDSGLYCVPMGATHTSMLMDIAVILRNLNISPTDLNAPVAVRIAN